MQRHRALGDAKLAGMIWIAKPETEDINGNFRLKRKNGAQEG